MTLKKILPVILLSMNALLTCAQDNAWAPDLPLEEWASGENKTLILYLSGDGGMNHFSEQLCDAFGKKGYSVVALNSRKYFWTYKSPAGFATDIGRVISHYLGRWNKTDCILVGFSFGADVLAFLPRLIVPASRDKISGLALLSPSASTDFVIRVSDLLGGDKDTDTRKFKVKPELESNTLLTLCLFGKEESLLLKRELAPSARLGITELPGDHYFNNDLKEIVNRITTFFKRK